MLIAFPYTVDAIIINGKTYFKLTLRDGTIDMFKTVEAACERAWKHSLE